MSVCAAATTNRGAPMLNLTSSASREPPTLGIKHPFRLECFWQGIIFDLNNEETAFGGEQYSTRHASTTTVFSSFNECDL